MVNSSSDSFLLNISDVQNKKGMFLDLVLDIVLGFFFYLKSMSGSYTERLNINVFAMSYGAQSGTKKCG